MCNDASDREDAVGAEMEPTSPMTPIQPEAEFFPSDTFMADIHARHQHYGAPPHVRICEYTSRLLLLIKYMTCILDRVI